jgi:hypothetical protein
MEAQSSRSIGRTNRFQAFALVCGLLPAGLTTGCVSTDEFLNSPPEKPPPVPCRVVATWNPEVVFTPDPVQGGNPTPGLVGRMYLFGEEISSPLVGDGAVVVDLYDLAQTADGKPGVMLEEWQIDPDTLKRLQRKDPVGWGYNLFLPWGTYKPDITHVQLRLRYVPPNGTPLYADSSPLTLNRDQALPLPDAVSKPVAARGQESPRNPGN